MLTQTEIQDWITRFTHFNIERNILEKLFAHHVPTLEELTAFDKRVSGNKNRPLKQQYHIWGDEKNGALLNVAICSCISPWVSYALSLIKQGTSTEYALATAALTGNLDQFKKVYFKLKKDHLYIGTFELVLISGSMDLFLHCFAMPEIIPALEQEYKNGPPFAVMLVKYGTVEMLTIALRDKRILKLFPKIIDKLPESSLPAFTQLLVADIQQSEYAVNALIALKAVASLHPTYEKLFAQQAQQLMAIFSKKVKSVGWVKAPLAELNDLKKAGVSEVNAVLEQVDNLMLIDEVKSALKSRLPRTQVHHADVYRSKLMQLARTSPSADIFYLIGQLIELSNNRYQNEELEKSEFFYYLLSAIYLDDEDKQQLEELLPEMLVVNTVEAELLYCLVAKHEGVETLLKQNATQVINALTKFIANEFLSQKPLLFLPAFEWISKPKVVGKPGTYWNPELRQLFNNELIKWLNQTNSEKDMVVILKKYQQILPAELFMKSLVQIMNSQSLNASQQTVVVLFATSIPSPSSDLSDSLPMMRRSLTSSKAIRQSAEIALFMNGVKIVVQPDLEGPIPQKIQQQIDILIKKNQFNRGEVAQVLMLLIDFCQSKRPGVTYDQHRNEQQLLYRLHQADSKLYYWVNQPQDLAPTLGSEQYQVLLQQELTTLQSWEDPHPPTEATSATSATNSQVSFDVLEGSLSPRTSRGN